ncbi:MAG TPA: urate hydroxylase PuuD [Candidatus Xenobia bacterium]|nr:urate hydroxylase PuuD [Candidatus Xenobia bacterium]
MNLLAQAPVLLPSGWDTTLQMALRWVHILSGITWIGLLYFFTLVATPLIPTLESPARGKVIAAVMPRALWWFRWSAQVAVIAGVTYWILILLAERAPLARTLLVWAALITTAFGIQLLMLRLAVLTKSRRAFVLAILTVVGLQGHLMMKLLPYSGATHRALSIAVGGGLGFFLLLNVWEIVWPAQRGFLAWCAANPGQPPPPELSERLRRAQLVSRASFWLTFPLLFFMAAASHFPFFVMG